MREYFIFAILIVILAALGFLYRQKIMSFFSKSNEPQIVEIRDFHCEGMDGFTFRYPVFKGWKVGGLRMSDNGTRCVISLRWPKSEIEPVIAPSIIVIYPLLREQNLDGDLLKNPQGVQYIYQRKEDQADFMPSNKAIINIQLIGISDGLGGGFKTDLFWKQVIESFRLTDLTIKQVPEDNSKFAGKWTWFEEGFGTTVSEPGKDGRSFTTSEQVDLELVVNGKNITGSIKAIRNSSEGGAQNERAALEGTIAGNIATVRFTTQSGESGNAALSYFSTASTDYNPRADILSWKIIDIPDENYYLPHDVTLKRAK